MNKAKALAISCIDFRFQKFIQKWLEDEGYMGKVDEINYAGCTRDLVKPIEQWHKQALEREIKMSVDLHDPEEILLFDHQDCGGYAQDGTIELGLRVNKDKLEHSFYAELAKEILHEEFPQKIIKIFYVRKNGQIEEF